jgi:hypothetical protein
MAGRYSCRGASVSGPVRTLVPQVGGPSGVVREVGEKPVWTVSAAVPAVPLGHETDT